MNRRQFIKHASFIVSALPVLSLSTLALAGCNAGGRSASHVTDSAAEQKNLSWQTKMVSDNEPGEPLIVSGTIYGPDGVKPLEGITLYVYHTDARGYYSDEDGNGQEPKPRLKGWMKTNAEGKYEFRTIKPASYPSSRNPAHIHGKLSGQGYPERWIEEYWFEGDPFISAEMRSRVKGTGKFSPIVTLQRGSDGVWKATRDFKLQ